LINLPFRPEDIGGALLEILSSGLYTDPLDCIREYVQNSVDANATNVTIHITGNSVDIMDDGDGMNLDEMLESRQFGLSPKSIEQHVGFRGIGVYSGFDICRKMRITSKKTGERIQHVLVFDFGAMRAMLDEDRKRKAPVEGKRMAAPANGPEGYNTIQGGETFSEAQNARVSLIGLLSQHTYIKREAAIGPVDHYMTLVQLQDISEAHIKQLSNLAELRNYLLQNLPIDFAEFEYKKVINDNLYAHVLGYSAVSIRLQSDGMGEEVVQKKLPGTLQSPTLGYIYSADGRQVAYYWACLNSVRERLEPAASGNGKEASSEETPTYEGFVYKMKGFTIGDRAKLRSLWGAKETLYRWYTGEIYVLDSSVRPNAERD
jgi:hypothetical protein